MINKKFVPVVLLVFVNALGSSILIPVLPIMLNSWHSPIWMYGVIIATYNLCMFWGSQLFGELSDMHGRRKLIFISHFGTLLSWCLFIILWLADSLWTAPVGLLLFILTFANVVNGITGGNNSVALAYATDVIPVESRNRYFSYIGGTFGFAMIVGPAIGSYLMASHYSYLLVAIFGVAVSGITLISIYLWLNESIKVKKPVTKISLLKPFKIVSNFKLLNSFPIVQKILYIKIFGMFTAASYTTMIIYFMLTKFSLTELEVGNLMLIIGTFLLFNQVVVVSLVTKYLGDLKSLAFALCCITVGLSFFPLLPNVYYFIGVYYFVNLGMSTMMVLIKKMVSQYCDPSSTGQVLGFEDGLTNLMYGFVPLIASFLFQAFSVKAYYIYPMFSGMGLIFLIIIWSKLKQQIADFNAQPKPDQTN